MWGVLDPTLVIVYMCCIDKWWEEGGESEIDVWKRSIKLLGNIFHT